MSREPGKAPMTDPLAFFLTWTTYGTWLPGDERGWTAKPGQFHTHDPQREFAARELMSERACYLEPEQRSLVEKTVADHCAIRGWGLHAVYCGMNHVHVVATAPQREPEEVMNQLKAWCTRRLKEQEQKRRASAKTNRQNWWTQRGSRRRLFDQTSMEEAIQYVLECQRTIRFEQ